jgi:hypothetical protein
MRIKWGGSMLKKIRHLPTRRRVDPSLDDSI